jgi:hypothetical protein
MAAGNMEPGEVASSEPSGNTSSPKLPAFNKDEVYWFTDWDDGVRHKVEEKRWAGLLGMIKTSQVGPERDEENLQLLLELAFWEAIETLRPSHPRKELVMNAFVALSTWEGYLRVSLQVVKLWFCRWIQLLRGGNWKQVGANNLQEHREYVRTLMEYPNK